MARLGSEKGSSWLEWAREPNSGTARRGTEYIKCYEINQTPNAQIHASNIPCSQNHSSHSEAHISELKSKTSGGDHPLRQLLRRSLLKQPDAAADLSHAVESGGEQGEDDASNGLDGDGRTVTALEAQHGELPQRHLEE